MSEKKPIAVVVPVYKVEPYLRRCVDSILAQTYQELEVWLVDDGSPDNCPAICDEYAAKDPRVQVIHQENRGLSGARNAGLEKMTADYVVFVDSDDEIRPEMIENLWDTMQQTGADISICGFQNVYPDDPERTESEAQYQGSGALRVFEGEDRFSLIWNDWIVACAQWNKLFKKEIFRDLRFPEGKLHEDEYVIHRELMLARRTAHIDRKLYLYYRHGGGITGKGSLKNSLHGMGAFYDRMSFFAAEGYPEQVVKSHERFQNAVAWAKQGIGTCPDSEEYLPQIEKMIEEEETAFTSYVRSLPLHARCRLAFDKKWRRWKLKLWHKLHPNG